MARLHRGFEAEAKAQSPEPTACSLPPAEGGPITRRDWESPAARFRAYRSMVQRQTPKPIYCGKCRYDVRGIASMVCPECGSDLLTVGIIDRLPTKWWASALVGAYIIAAAIGPLVVIPSGLARVFPSVVGVDYGGSAQYRIWPLALDDSPSVVLLYDAKARHLRWRWPFGDPYAQTPINELHLRFAEPLPGQWVEPERSRPASIRDPARRQTSSLRLKVSEERVSLIASPEVSEQAIEAELAELIASVSDLPPEHCERAARLLMDDIRKAPTVGAFGWRLGERFPYDPDEGVYRWFHGSHGGSGYGNKSPWPMYLSFILVPCAWWLLFGYIPRRYGILRAMAPPSMQ